MNVFSLVTFAIPKLSLTPLWQIGPFRTDLFLFRRASSWSAGAAVDRDDDFVVAGTSPRRGGDSEMEVQAQARRAIRRELATAAASWHAEGVLGEPVRRALVRVVDVAKCVNCGWRHAREAVRAVLDDGAVGAPVLDVKSR